MNKRAAFSDTSDKLKDWYQGINPDVRGAILRGLAGAVAGGAITGGLAAVTPHDPEDRHAVVAPALMGALMGGAGASLLPIGTKMMGGGIHVGNEKKRPVGARLAELLGAPIINHPFATGGTAAAGWFGRDALSALLRGIKDRKGQGHIGRRTIDTLRDDTHWEEAARGLSRGHGMGATEFARAARTLPRANRGRLAAIPLALGAGALADKYLKGEY